MRLAVVNDHSMVVDGLAAAIEVQDPKLSVVARVVGSSLPRVEVHVALLDDFAQADAAEERVRALVGELETPVLVQTGGPTADCVSRLMAAGASGVIARPADAADTCAMLRSVAAGHTVRSRSDRRPGRLAHWPGRTAGLSERQAEVLAYVSRGLTVADVAAVMALSPNSVKTHLRHVHGHLGVHNRAEATRAAVQLGLVSVERQHRDQDA